MSRPLRIDYPGAWHHVMNRSRRGTRLYPDNEDYELFLSLVQETSAMHHMIESFYSKKNQPSILGEEKFLNWVKETFFRKKSDQEIPESKRLAPEINLINDIVATVYKVELSQLFVAKRGFEKNGGAF